nr:uncharacterized protein LOC109186882 [Ipomoea trifida]
MSKATALTRPSATSSCFLTTSAASLSRRITTWRLIRRKSYRRARWDQRQGFLQVVGHHGIRSSGDNLVFKVGMVTAKYPSKNFDESPECE